MAEIDGYTIMSGRNRKI